MESREVLHMLAAMIIGAVVASFALLIQGSFSLAGLYALCGAAVVGVVIIGRKTVAYLLDAGVEHELWTMHRYSFAPHHYLKKGAPVGIILPLFLTLFSLGTIKFPALLTYETRALKQRAAKRFGYYSYTEMTDWHNAIIGVAGIATALIGAAVAYVLNIEPLAKFAVYYASVNMLPFSKLDGTQIFFGNRILYTTTAIITLIFLAYTFVI